MTPRNNWALRHFKGVLLAVGALPIVLLALLASSAQAAKVANPGNVTFRFESGQLQIRDEVFDAADPDEPITGSGTIQQNGALTITSLNFPDPDPIDGPLGEIRVRILVQGNPTGNLNPLTGVMTLQIRVSIKVEGTGIGSNCYIGPPSNPITLNMTTETTSPPPPNGPISGSRYNTITGFVTLVDNSFGVPGASGCNTFPINVNNEINDQLDLPSPPGNNTAILTASSNPIIQAAIRPAFTASPATGVAPLPVSFNAGSTFSKVAVASYQWDFTNDGIVDQVGPSPTASHTYVSPGTYTARLRVVDVDGDSAQTTRQIVVNRPQPDLSIDKSHEGDFITGQTEHYLIEVTNDGTAATTEPATVTDTLPAGLAYAGSSGDGWDCSSAGQDVTCTNDASVAPGESLPDLTIDVVAAESAVGFLTNTAAVATFDDPNSSNDSDSDVTRVLLAGVDLALTKALEEEEGMLRGRRATYVLSVENVGRLATTERTRVVDQLPEDVSYVGASGGLDWVCSESAGEVRCFSDEVVDPGESLQDIRIRVDVDVDADAEIVNSATVTTAGDGFADNDTGTSAESVAGYAADFALAKEHDGDFIVGEPGFYRLHVTNVGTAPAGNDVTVLDQLPDGMDFLSATGDGWSCSAAPPFVTCTHAGQVEAGDALPTLTLKVRVRPVATGDATNVAGVFSGDDFNAENDVASDPTLVRPPRPDLAIAKSHEGNFQVGEPGAYTIEVSNTSAERADGPTTVTDTLPGGLNYAGASGSGWVCGASGQTVTCTRATAIAGLETAPPITLNVNPTSAAIGEVTNVANVQNSHDTQTFNNRATDPTIVMSPRQTPTRLLANGVVVDARNGQVKVLAGVGASLTDRDGNPLAGKRINFRVRPGGPLICRADTNADGVASCEPKLDPLLRAIAQLRYFAKYAGDLNHSPARDEGAILNIAGLRLP